MKMKKAEDQQAAKAEKMRHPDWNKYSGWVPPADAEETVSKVVRKAKRVLDVIKEDDVGDGN